MNASLPMIERSKMAYGMVVCFVSQIDNYNYMSGKNKGKQSKATAPSSTASATTATTTPSTAATTPVPSSTNASTPVVAAVATPVTQATPSESGAGDEAIIDDDNVNGSGSGTSGTDVRHPLQHSWVMWYDSPTCKAAPVAGQKNSWASALRIASFETVEDFWCLFNNLQAPSSLPQKANYWFFKDGIKPEWEDAGNKSGGRWTVEFEGKKDLDRMNKCWTHCLLSMIGEQFGDDGHQICGAVVSIRGKHNRLQVWTRDASAASAAACKRIGSTLKRLLDVKETIGYNPHESKGFEGRNLYEA